MSLGIPNRALNGGSEVTMYVSERHRIAAMIRGLAEELVRRVEGLSAVIPPAPQDPPQRERLALFRRISDRLGHELRHPLGVIRVSNHVLRKSLRGGDPGALAALAHIERSVTRCDRILEEILDHSRITDVEPEPTPLDAWLAGVLSEQAPPSGVTLHPKFGLPAAEVTFDRERLRRAVINVLDNAYQAMTGEGAEDSPVRANFLTVRTGDSDGRVEIVFEDTGPGIPANILARIFEPLFSTKAFGLGLGLPVVMHIMELHGGDIGIETEEGRGTLVRLRLPREAIESKTAR